MRVHPFAVFASFVVLGLSPSFLDWQQADERQRKQILAFYGIAGALIFLGSERS